MKSNQDLPSLNVRVELNYTKYKLNSLGIWSYNVGLPIEIKNTCYDQ